MIIATSVEPSLMSHSRIIPFELLAMYNGETTDMYTQAVLPGLSGGRHVSP